MYIPQVHEHILKNFLPGSQHMTIFVQDLQSLPIKVTHQSRHVCKLQNDDQRQQFHKRMFYNEKLY